MALSFAERGGIILFSPAFASFGMFRNEYDRGEKFNKMVNAI
jgi:UDP-N-acetylmuramoylalanine--D-glutamate ligase